MSNKRVSVKIGTYTDRSGVEKGKWKNIGELVTKADGGQFLSLDATILNAACFALMNRERNDRIICSLFSDEDSKQPASAAPQSAGNVADMTDDIPF